MSKDLYERSRQFLFGTWLLDQELTLAKEACALRHDLRRPSIVLDERLRVALSQFELPHGSKADAERRAILEALCKNAESRRAGVEEVLKALSNTSGAPLTPRTSTDDAVSEAVRRAGEALAVRRAKEKALEKLGEMLPAVVSRAVQKVRAWQLYFGPQRGEAGEVKKITVTPKVLFRADKIMATDDADPPGSGTEIALRIEHPSRLELNAPTSALAQGYDADLVCHKAMSIEMGVRFLRSCTFNAVLFGKAVS